VRSSRSWSWSLSNSQRVSPERLSTKALCPSLLRFSAPPQTTSLAPCADHARPDACLFRSSKKMNDLAPAAGSVLPGFPSTRPIACHTTRTREREPTLFCRATTLRSYITVIQWSSGLLSWRKTLCFESGIEYLPCFVNSRKSIEPPLKPTEEIHEESEGGRSTPSRACAAEDARSHGIHFVLEERSEKGRFFIEVGTRWRLQLTRMRQRQRRRRSEVGRCCTTRNYRSAQ
jgi:hypothetical protein